jgi:hypothetical protein
MRSNLVLFVLVNQNFIGDEDEGGSSKAKTIQVKTSGHISL